MAIPHLPYFPLLLPHLRSLFWTCQDPCLSVFTQKSSPGIISPHQDHSFPTLYSTVCLTCPLHKSQEFAGKATKLTWGGSLMSVVIARVCIALYSRLFPRLIILVKSRVKGCCLTTKSQISIHSTGKTALKLQKTATTSLTDFSWQFNSSSSTSTNCAQGREMWWTIDVVWWSHALEESRLLSTEKLSIYSLSILYSPAWSILLCVPGQGVKLTHQPWWGADLQHTYTAQELHLVPSTTPQWIAVVASRAADQGSIPRHGCQSRG